MTNKLWNKLAGNFNTYKIKVWQGASDNIDAVWPVILSYVKTAFANPEGLRALDFGCGTGMFCRELKGLGFGVCGIDISEKMVRIGKANINQKIELLVGSAQTAQKYSEKNGKFDLITSIMVLQFLEEKEIALLCESLKIGGQIIFANHSLEYLKENGITNILHLTNKKIPVNVYPRPLKEYNKLLKKFGCKNVFDVYSGLSKKFFNENKINKISKNPKYQVLGYKKIAKGVFK